MHVERRLLHAFGAQLQLQVHPGTYAKVRRFLIRRNGNAGRIARGARKRESAPSMWNRTFFSNHTCIA